MIYEYEDTVPKSTAKSAMRRTKMKLAPGVIHKIELDFPAGCLYLAHATLWDGEHQVWPTNVEDSFNAEDYTISFTEYFPLRPPAELELRTWNLDETYPHTIRVRIGILPPEMVAPWQNLDKLTQVLKGIVGASL
jgi:hypothetical protein